MKKNTFLLKQDINMLENPLWFQHVKLAEHKEGHIWKDIEGYTYRAGYKLPTKTDIIFLLYILKQCQKRHWKRKLTFSQYEILVGSGAGKDKWNYLRLRESFKRWNHVGVEYSGIFYNGKQYETVGFGIIDFWGLDKETKKIEVHLNEVWISKIKESSYYKLIDFDEIKKLRSPLSIRLFEIVKKSFQGRNEWRIDSIKLAKKIPLQKKYPSQIIQAIHPAINRIRAKTDLNVHLELDKQERGKIILIFRLKKNVQQPPKFPPVLKNKYIPKETDPEELNLVPVEHRSSVKNIVSKMCKEKGIEYVTQKIEYVNSMHSTNYAAYLASSLRNGFGSEIDLEAKKYEAFKKGSVNCFNKNHGNCGASWDTHKNNKTSDCYWCVRFERSREATKNKTS